MVQHLLLMFAVVPCWIKGIPPWVYQPIIDHRWSRWMLTWVPRAVPSFAIVTLIMGLWHVPVLYDATLSNEPLHALQHMFFLLAGFLFYWPLMSTRPETPQLSPPVKCLYLFVQTIPAGIIGALITYAGPGLYPHYEEARCRPWGIDLKTDQEIAGLIMWVGMNTLFLVMLTVIFLGWAGREERDDYEALREESRAKRQQAAEPDHDPGGSGHATGFPVGSAVTTGLHPTTTPGSLWRPMWPYLLDVAANGPILVVAVLARSAKLSFRRERSDQRQRSDISSPQRTRPARRTCSFVSRAGRRFRAGLGLAGRPGACPDPVRCRRGRIRPIPKATLPAPLGGMASRATGANRNNWQRL